MAVTNITFYANGATVYEDGAAGTATSVGIRDFPVYAPDPSSFTASVRWVPQTISFEKDGYDFLEWNTAADGTGTSFQIGDLIANSASSYQAYAVYAIWKRPPVTYTTNSDELTSIADAIRAKGGTSEDLVYPEGFVGAINNISTTGGVIFITKTLAKNATLTITLSQNATGVIFFGGASSTRRGIASYSTNASGNALCTELIDATDITITTNNTSSFTITNGGAANVFILFMHYHGDEPTFS
jgi:hypothetical protein